MEEVNSQRSYCSGRIPSELLLAVTKPAQEQGVRVMFRFRQAGEVALVYHSVYLEFAVSRAGCRCVAGKFSIERVNPEGSRNVAVIKLYLRIIEQASAPARANLKNGFAPLAGLNKLDRYAEVLGHEMAHAVDILFSPERAKWVDEGNQIK